MNLSRTFPFALAALLALAACSNSAAAPRIEAAGCGDFCTEAFNGSHAGLDVWADAAASEGVVIVDVRTPDEYAQGHVAGAVNIDVSGESFTEQVSGLDPKVEYAVYCRTGSRSRAALEVMAELGVVKTLGLEGGLSAWVDAGYALIAGED